MASISGLYSSSSTFKPDKFTPKTPLSSSLARDSISVAVPNRSNFFERCCDRASIVPAQSVAREIPANLSNTNDGLPEKKKKGLEKDSRELWRRYVDWLYQHRELGLYSDVSRIGFTDEFVEKMEPKFQATLRAMKELDEGSIANPDEGRMVGHYWLRNSKLAPNSFLRLQIENMLEALCKFADDVISDPFVISMPPPDVTGSLHMGHAMFVTIEGGWLMVLCTVMVLVGILFFFLPLMVPMKSTLRSFVNI